MSVCLRRDSPSLIWLDIGRHRLHLLVVQPDCCRQLTRLSNCETPPGKKVYYKTMYVANMYVCSVCVCRVCIPVLQDSFPLQILWKTSPVRPDSSTGIDAILKQVPEKCWARERVVHKDMVMFSHKWLCQGLHHRPPRPSSGVVLLPFPWYTSNWLK